MNEQFKKRYFLTMNDLILFNVMFHNPTENLHTIVRDYD